MGAKSKLTVPERRKVVLSLIRREEPAAVLARRYGMLKVRFIAGVMSFWRLDRRRWLTERIRQTLGIDRLLNSRRTSSNGTR